MGCVVLGPECIDNSLCLGDVDEGPVRFQAFTLQRLMPPLDLPRRGRRPELGQQMINAVLAADPVEQHLRRTRLVELPAELFAIKSVRISSGTPYRARAPARAR